MSDLPVAPELVERWRVGVAELPGASTCPFCTAAARAAGAPTRARAGAPRRFLLKLAKNRPSWTIQAQPGPAIGPFHWDSRRLSVRELCRLQTFPDDVQITGGRTSQQKQLGNAVPSLLAEVLGREIGRQLLGRKAKGGLKLLPPDRSPAPPPTPPAKLPARFKKLAGNHEAHPGTGKGYGAVARAEAEA